MRTMEIEAVVGSRREKICHTTRALIRRYYPTDYPYQSRDWIIGLIGDRGSGKSIGGANIAVRDFGFMDEPMFSNMKIKVNVKVDEPTARQINCEPGIETYEASRITREEFLALDSRYDGGVIFLDEINIEYGESRRSSSNVNLGTDTVVQQLRKGQCGLIYTVINEMYVDPRIRENTDIFIRCCDVALNPQNLKNKMQPGILFEWTLYAWTSRLLGNGMTYKDTHKPSDVIQLKLGDTWGMIDTWERQAVGGRKYTEVKKLMPIELGEPEDVSRAHQDPLMAEIAKRLDVFWANHAEDGDVIEIFSKDLCRELGVDPDDWAYIFKVYVKRHFLKDIEIRRPGGKVKYIIKNRVLV